MGLQFRLSGAVLALSVLLAQPARAQDLPQAGAVNLPPIDVGFSRTVTGIMVGTSSSVITTQDIERSPSQSLPDILQTQAGIQVLHQANPFGLNDAVDLRGFGAFAQQNVLILVNGRRYQDFDLQGFDFSIIPVNSIERIEITRGNSGTVLYGDGAVGGVINIVTKTQNVQGASGKIEGALGSYGFAEGWLSAGAASGPWSTSVYSNDTTSRGYRQNSEARQENATGNLSYRTPAFDYYLTVAGDRQRQNFPGALYNFNPTFPVSLSDPRSSITPSDWAHKQDFNVTTGFTVPVWSGARLIVDGGIRRKFQQSDFFNYFNGPGFSFNPNSTESFSYLNTGVTTSSFTPRLDISHHLFGLPGQLLTGVDIYDTLYDSDRAPGPDQQLIHHYDIRQTTAAFYGMNKTSVLPDLDISVGGRIQRNRIDAMDLYNPSADTCFPFCYPSGTGQTPSFNSAEWQYAAHAGAEYRFGSMLAVFGRVARAFRLPNADERVGSGSAFSTTFPANFALRTQTSHDVEGGIRFKWQKLEVQSSVYQMDLTNEIHFDPVNFIDFNLNPTRRRGWENTVTYAVSNDVRLRGY